MMIKDLVLLFVDLHTRKSDCKDTTFLAHAQKKRTRAKKNNERPQGLSRKALEIN
ncbi:MAG: hypothetical protein J6X88_07515 [Bacteroidales bacterium]|nr:hypothetical protein [Bacteroidales bacterium]